MNANRLEDFCYFLMPLILGLSIADSFNDGIVVVTCIKFALCGVLVVCGIVLDYLR